MQHNNNRQQQNVVERETHTHNHTTQNFDYQPLHDSISHSRRLATSGGDVGTGGVWPASVSRQPPAYADIYSTYAETHALAPAPASSAWREGGAGGTGTATVTTIGPHPQSPGHEVVQTTTTTTLDGYGDAAFSPLSFATSDRIIESP